MKTLMLALGACMVSLTAPTSASDEMPEPSATTIQVAENLALAAELHLPDATDAAPAVVLYPGSQGSVNLDGVAEHLAARGIVALDLNKRGVAGSQGHWRDETIERQADDVLAAVRFLRSLDSVDAQRIGVVGHSQGGWVAQLAAARSDDVAFVVLLAGPAQTVKEQILTDERLHLVGWGVPQAEADGRIAMFSQLLDAAMSNPVVCGPEPTHYLCGVISYDPAEALAAIDVPVLALYGGRDPMTPPSENEQRLREALTKLEADELATHVFPEANHLFWQAETGLRDEYADLLQEYVPGFLEMISEWIAAR